MISNVKIATLTYKVVEVDNLTNSDGQGLFGQITYENQTIELERGLTSERLPLCLVHELLHEFSTLYAVGLTEQTVATLASFFVSLLKDNPDLVDVITGK